MPCFFNNYGVFSVFSVVNIYLLLLLKGLNYYQCILSFSILLSQNVASHIQVILSALRAFAVKMFYPKNGS